MGCPLAEQIGLNSRISLFVKFWQYVKTTGFRILREKVFVGVTVYFFFFKESAEKDACACLNCLSRVLVQFFIEFIVI